MHNDMPIAHGNERYDPLRTQLATVLVVRGKPRSFVGFHVDC